MGRTGSGGARRLNKKTARKTKSARVKEVEIKKKDLEGGLRGFSYNQDLRTLKVMREEKGEKKK